MKARAESKYTSYYPWHQLMNKPKINTGTQTLLLWNHNWKWEKEEMITYSIWEKEEMQHHLIVKSKNFPSCKCKIFICKSRLDNKYPLTWKWVIGYSCWRQTADSITLKLKTPNKQKGLESRWELRLHLIGRFWPFLILVVKVLQPCWISGWTNESTFRHSRKQNKHLKSLFPTVSSLTTKWAANGPR